MGDRFAGMNAVISGASRGIGGAAAQRLAAEGANVAIVARTPDKSDKRARGTLAEKVDQLKQYGNKVVAIEADMASPQERATVIEQAIDGLGDTIDILINNAAANGPHSLLDYSLERRQLLFEINFNAPIDLMQGAIPGMREKGRGWIVNVSSGTARLHQGPPFGVSGLGLLLGLYGSSKAALNRVTNAFAVELYGTGVRVNTCEPKSAVMSEGAEAKGMQGIPESSIESMEAMVEGLIALCDCEEERTGKVFNSLDLLDELNRTVMTLDGSAPFPGGYRRILS
jgi:NAD(P)-dependent dehydrogenase (short-subunit alcohol dehydrogenase family)